MEKHLFVTRIMPWFLRSKFALQIWLFPLMLFLTENSWGLEIMWIWFCSPCWLYMESLFRLRISKIQGSKSWWILKRGIIRPLISMKRIIIPSSWKRAVFPKWMSPSLPKPLEWLSVSLEKFLCMGRINRTCLNPKPSISSDHLPRKLNKFIWTTTLKRGILSKPEAEMERKLPTNPFRSDWLTPNWRIL